MPRFHEIVLAYEGECSLCGGCCAGCGRLVRRGQRWVCRDHPDKKPGHCHLFPIGYAFELMPPTCTLRPTATLTVDETIHLGRMRVSGRAGPAFFSPAETVGSEAAEEAEAPKRDERTLYVLQGEVEGSEDPYACTPEQRLASIARLVDDLRGLERAPGSEPESPLPWTEAQRSEMLLRELLRAVSLYATQRDVILGDLFE